jgi:hypothetical protein
MRRKSVKIKLSLSIKKLKENAAKFFNSWKGQSETETLQENKVI